MPKELYLYSPIYDFVAQGVMQSIDDNMDGEIVLRVNSPGGSVFSNYGICAKISEHGNVTAQVDGTAMSSAANLLVYANKVHCLDVSTFLFHRADMYCETDQDKSFLAKINKDLKAKMLLKIDASKFKEVTSVSIDEMFDSENRIDIILNAQQAKKIGLVDKINKLSPAEVEAFNTKMFQVAASSENKPKQKPTNMTIESLKAEHPALYAQIVALGVEQEKDRVEACMAFIEIDPVGVKAAVESGKNLTQKQMAEFSLKAFSKDTLKALKDESAKEVTTNEVLETKPETVEAKKEKAAIAEAIKLATAK